VELGILWIIYFWSVVWQYQGEWPMHHYQLLVILVMQEVLSITQIETEEVGRDTFFFPFREINRRLFGILPLSK
jgi:hypothetical protein